MIAFTRLLEALVLAPSAEARRRHLVAYFAATPDPDRGWALALLARRAPVKPPTAPLIRRLAARRLDPVLLALAHEHVGDLAEAVALGWERPQSAGDDTSSAPGLADCLSLLADAATGSEGQLSVLEALLDRLPAGARRVLLRLGAPPPVGVTPELLQEALALLAPLRSAADIRAIWSALEPPFVPFFAWLEGRGPSPAGNRPVGLIEPMRAAAPPAGEAWVVAGGYVAEWKLAGIRAQLRLAGEGGAPRLHLMSGEDVAPRFPELQALPLQGAESVVEGLLIVRTGGGGDLAAIQRRLARARPNAALLAEAPVSFVAFDLLWQGDDLRALPFAGRRQRLEAWGRALGEGPVEIAGQFTLPDAASVAALRRQARSAGHRGLMLKHPTAGYGSAGPDGGPGWVDWPHDPLTTRLALLYLQRDPANGALELTFAGRDRDGTLVPVCRVAAPPEKPVRQALEAWARAHTVEKFGPVRSLGPGLGGTLAFQSAEPAPRRRCGFTLSEPVLLSLDWDFLPQAADSLVQIGALTD
ncbi:ATP-dependent DNA ligase [Radicibacter daui]|uniref:ATP-dependent DNA ligase n=1 Tax=Radicibacter daui TaxID=3064829 RepID=UPI004046F7B8